MMPRLNVPNAWHPTLVYTGASRLLPMTVNDEDMQPVATSESCRSSQPILRVLGQKSLRLTL